METWALSRIGFSTCGVLLWLTIGSAAAQDNTGKKAGGTAPVVPSMVLTSPAFADGTDIPAKYTQLAGDMVVSPELNWTNAPINTQSFVLLMHDVDVTRNRTTEDQTHWLVWNIPATAKGLPENVPAQPTLQDGTVQGLNGVDKIGYRGPGAPAIAPKHHYTFELFALDKKLDLRSDTPRADVIKALNGHILGKAVCVGFFHRPN
jgi:Raf kinase inhibitor-like YbhB/YbcL family protein